VAATDPMRFEPAAEWLAPQPLERAVALPAPFYTQAGAFEWERRGLIGKSWQLCAHRGQVAEPGDHALAEVAGLPLLVVRGEDGALRAFHNVCRHRAGPLATCDGRGARTLRCRYHGWTYALDGRLRNAPEMGGAADFDVGAIRLPEVRVDTWQGLVFVALDAAPPLPEVLAGIDERVGRPLDSYAFHHRVAYDVACNWKVYIDNFLEGYHVPLIHPALNQLLDYRSYVTETSAWYSLQHSPLENAQSAGNFYGDGEALYYFIWPNTMLNILPGRLQTNRIVPLAVDRCRVEFDFYYPPDHPAASGSAGERERDARRRQDQELSHIVQREDVDMCELVQARLASGSYAPGRLNPRRENGVHHFHELVRRAYRELA